MAESRPAFDAFTGKNQKVEFEGVVIERLQSDGFWCGMFASFQGIRYRVTKVIAGPIKEKEVTIYHALVCPPLCEVGGDGSVVMSKRIFAVGNLLRVKADRTPDGALVGWEQVENAVVLQTEKRTAEPDA